jgi:2-oxoglutarate ferredoxin oxidoreductase subunit alpha
MVIDGSASLVAGSLQAGVNTYFAYPMSPSSAILNYFANAAKDYNLLVKQVEDEISVAQITLGAMHAGTRALCATSGGGFDLMSESLSLSAMIETPWVCIIAQRPGPATGLPTWTAQADLNLAIYSGHGEFTRLVIAVSDALDSYELIQQAFNYAELVQIPVVVLTEASIAMSNETIELFPEGLIPIQRGLITGDQLQELKSKDRFGFTETGISKRWLPGKSQTTYYANGDEHTESGVLTEKADPVEQMVDKRYKKKDYLLSILPEPVVYKSAQPAKIGIVGWGSTKGVILDAQLELQSAGIEVDYLHYSYVFPLKTQAVREFFASHEQVYIYEGNREGQLGELIKKETGLEGDKVLKWNGRRFYLEEVVENLNKTVV